MHEESSAHFAECVSIKSTAVVEPCNNLDELTFGCPFFGDSAAQEEGGQQGKQTACACTCVCICVARDFCEPMLNLNGVASARISLLQR